MTQPLPFMDRAEFKDRLHSIIENALNRGSDSRWVKYAEAAVKTWGPEEWGDILDYMLWDLQHQGMVPAHLEPPPIRVRKDPAS